MPKRTVLYLFLALLVVAPLSGVGNATAQSRILTEINDLDLREHVQEGFILNSSQTIQIEAIGVGPYEGRNWDSGRDNRDLWQANAWILNAKTRELVWNLESEDTERMDDELRRFDGTITLPAGMYEVHYGAYIANTFTYTVRNGVSSLVRRIFDRSDRDDRRHLDRDDFRDMQITVSGKGEHASRSQISSAAHSLDESAIVSLSPYRSEADRYGFELTEATELELLAIGELDRDGQYDYGWILNTETGDRVWEMEYYDSDHAGGGNKNRVIQDEFRLPAGRYVAYFVSDDSHDQEEWNTMPPFDPEFWGLTLWVRHESARSSVRSFEYEPVPSDRTFISLTGVGDDELLSEGFSLNSAMDVHVYAIGEGTGRDMADYAWIVDTNSRRRVWSMDYRDTEHAGGASKNRLASETIRLDAGSYVVYYRTDGSHSSRDWNSSPPAEADYWGVSLYASSVSNADKVGPAMRDSDRNVLAEVVRIGDNDRVRVGFKLDRESRVRIIAVGEGTSGDMDDGAWIEDRDTGRTVWEQTYRMTEHAGGAQKNRIFDGTILLPAGEYYLRYRSDGSHSYEDWNASPPNDPDSWGVTVLRGD